MMKHDGEDEFYNPLKINDGRPLTASKLAARWECSQSTIISLCAQGKLRHFRLGKGYRIPTDSVIEYEIGNYGVSPDQAKVPSPTALVSNRLEAARTARQHRDDQTRREIELLRTITREWRWEKTIQREREKQAAKIARLTNQSDSRT